MLVQKIKPQKIIVFPQKIKKLTELCRICCNAVVKQNFEAIKYTKNIENHFYINFNIDDNALHPEDMYQKFH